MKCNKCGQVTEPTNYDDIWYDFVDPDGKVRIYCPTSGCLPGEIIATEDPDPAKYVFTFGKYKGKRLTEVNDEGYLHWLHEKYDDPLLKRCIEQTY